LEGRYSSQALGKRAVLFVLWEIPWARQEGARGRPGWFGSDPVQPRPLPDQRPASTKEERLPWLREPKKRKQKKKRKEGEAEKGETVRLLQKKQSLRRQVSVGVRAKKTLLPKETLGSVLLWEQQGKREVWGRKSLERQWKQTPPESQTAPSLACQTPDRLPLQTRAQAMSWMWQGHSPCRSK